MKLFRICLLSLFLAAGLRASGQGTLAPVFHLGDFAGCKFITNIDSTITAMERGIHRDGNDVYSRVFTLKPVVMKAGVSYGTEDSIMSFISQYHPPQIPYTSAAKAMETGEEKFNCLEFAEDIVSQAASNGISAEVVGIKFQGKMTGHAVAGFPTADGSMLFFDSTPGAGKVSHGAHQAFVQVGQPYSRSDGGILNGVGRLPIEELIPVTPLVQTPEQPVSSKEPLVLTPATLVTVQSQEQVQARGILYAKQDSLEVSDGQLKRWAANIVAQAAARAKLEAARQKAAEDASLTGYIRALHDNEEMAAKGDAYAEMRMGERYLAGDGIPRDIYKARAYLGMAAAHGNRTADKELEQLNASWDSLVKSQP